MNDFKQWVSATGAAICLLLAAACALTILAAAFSFDSQEVSSSQPTPRRAEIAIPGDTEETRTPPTSTQVISLPPTERVGEITIP